MYRIVSNQALNAARSRSRRRPTPLEAEALSERADAGWLTGRATTGDPSASAEHTALLDAVRAALDALPESLRLCWLLREIENYSYQDIADITSVSLDAARGRLYRARLQLAEAMTAWR